MTIHTNKEASKCLLMIHSNFIPSLQAFLEKMVNKPVVSKKESFCNSANTNPCKKPFPLYIICSFCRIHSVMIFGVGSLGF